MNKSEGNDPGKAIESVSAERWGQAQEWEKNHWVQTQQARSRFGKNWIWRILNAVGLVQRYRGDDWNGWWKNQFDGYRFLPPRIQNAIEVGCGPYTNIRLMQGHVHFDHIVLSDPLIRTYVKFKLTFVSDMYRSMQASLDDHPLEQLPYASNYFDLAVMINVLDHVRDAGACMDNLVRIVRPGGIVILGQDLTNEEDMAVALRDTEASGETGHPIKLQHEWFDPWINTQRFEPIISKVLPRPEGRAPAAHYGTLLFAGRKRA